MTLVKQFAFIAQVKYKSRYRRLAWSCLLHLKRACDPWWFFMMNFIDLGDTADCLWEANGNSLKPKKTQTDFSMMTWFLKVKKQNICFFLNVFPFLTSYTTGISCSTATWSLDDLIDSTTSASRRSPVFGVEWAWPRAKASTAARGKARAPVPGVVQWGGDGAGGDGSKWYGGCKSEMVWECLDLGFRVQ